MAQQQQQLSVDAVTLAVVLRQSAFLTNVATDDLASAASDELTWFAIHVAQPRIVRALNIQDDAERNTELQAIRADVLALVSNIVPDAAAAIELSHKNKQLLEAGLKLVATNKVLQTENEGLKSEVRTLAANIALIRPQ